MRGFPQPGILKYSHPVYFYKNIANMVFSSIYKHSVHFILFRSVSVCNIRINNEQSLKEQRNISSL